MKILFQGDSITNAFRKPEEINPPYQLGNGYPMSPLGAGGSLRRGKADDCPPLKKNGSSRSQIA